MRCAGTVCTAPVPRPKRLTVPQGTTGVWPGTYGGVLTPPATADGIVSVATLHAPSTLHPDQPAYFGRTLGTVVAFRLRR
jgi:hypothetical protein